MMKVKDEYRYSKKSIIISEGDDAYETLVIKHGDMVEVIKQTEKAILGVWELALEGQTYRVDYQWVPKSKLDFS